MKVTIIGGSGFIGTRIVDHFTQFKGYDFRIVDIRDSHFFNNKIQPSYFIKCAAV